MYEATTSLKPLTASGTWGIEEAELKAAFAHCLESGQEEQLRLIVRIFLFWDLFTEDVDRAKAILDAMVLVKAAKAAAANAPNPTLTFEKKGIKS